jgi:hypothetical protein
MSDRNGIPKEDVVIAQDLALDAVGVAASMLPVLGGPAGAILSGIATERKLRRVWHELKQLDSDFQRHSEHMKGQFIASEAFEDLLEQGLKKIATEQNETKRKLFRHILFNAATLADAELYDEQLEYMNLLERLQPAHVEVLQKIYSTHPLGAPVSSSRFGNLQLRFQAQPPYNLMECLKQMERLGMVNTRYIEVKSGNDHNLRSMMTPYGERFVAYLQG